MDQRKWLDSLQKQFNENPLGAIAIGSLAATALSKVISSVTQARRSRVWDREVARRERQQYGVYRGSRRRRI